MGRRRAARPAVRGCALAIALAALVALPLGALTAPPAQAASSGYTAVGEVPDDVRAAFTGEALRRGVATPETNAMAVLEAGPVHQLFGYTDAFYDDAAASPPVEPRDEWVAGITGDGVPRGWLRVWKQDGGPAQPTGWLADPQQGAAMVASTESAFVEVPWDHAFFTLVDGVATPIITSEWDAGLGPRDLAQVQADFVVARAEAEAASAGCGPGCSGGSPGAGWGGPASPEARSAAVWRTVTWVGVGGLVVGGVAAGLVLQRRRERASLLGQVGR